MNWRILSRAARSQPRRNRHEGWRDDSSRCVPLPVKLLLGICFLLASGAAAAADQGEALDERVKKFLESRKGTWRDLNVPEVDGRTLRDLIVKNRYTRALEIGTSTGHSTVWMAWGLAETGGKLITIEIDPRRRNIAIENLKEAGLSEYVDSRLADAHDLVPKLEGPFDFVFSDADKEWYTSYFKELWPKVTPGGCFVAHNVTMNNEGISEFLAHLKTVEDGETRIDEQSRAGLSITCKKK
ncbi:MAG TPA: class I SAM-dependent methyltransferase [Steroidobacteraceae bacterium]|jgi:predicted O-methyltransferase YrrM